MTSLNSLLRTLDSIMEDSEKSYDDRIEELKTISEEDGEMHEDMAQAKQQKADDIRAAVKNFNPRPAQPAECTMCEEDEIQGVEEGFYVMHPKGQSVSYHKDRESAEREAKQLNQRGGGTYKVQQDVKESEGEDLLKLARVVKSVETPEQYEAAKKYAKLMWDKLKQPYYGSFNSKDMKSINNLMNSINSDLKAKRRELGLGATKSYGYEFEESELHEGHQVKEIVKSKNGGMIGEIGFDNDAPAGQGPFYMKHFSSGTQMGGFDSKEDAMNELQYYQNLKDKGYSESEDLEEGGEWDEYTGGNPLPDSDDLDTYGGEDDEDELEEVSKSQSQARMMAAAAHNPKFAKKVGVPGSVAKEFNRADTGKDWSKLPQHVAETPYTKAKPPYRPGSIDPSTGKVRAAPKGTYAADQAAKKKSSSVAESADYRRMNRLVEGKIMESISVNTSVSTGDPETGAQPMKTLNITATGEDVDMLSQLLGLAGVQSAGEPSDEVAVVAATPIAQSGPEGMVDLSQFDTPAEPCEVCGESECHCESLEETEMSDSELAAEIRRLESSGATMSEVNKLRRELNRRHEEKRRSSTDLEENQPDWPSNTETNDDAFMYSGGLNKPKAYKGSTGQTTRAIVGTVSMDESVELERSLWSLYKSVK